MQDVKAAFTWLITDLVRNGGITSGAGDNITLKANYMGFNAGTAFHSEQEVIDKLVLAALTRYGQVSGLKVAS